MDEIKVIYHTNGKLAYRITDGMIEITDLRVPEGSRRLGIAAKLIDIVSEKEGITDFCSRSLTGAGEVFVERKIAKMPIYTYKTLPKELT